MGSSSEHPLSRNLEAACQNQPLRNGHRSERRCSCWGIPSRPPHRLGRLGFHPARPPPAALALETTHRPALHAALPALRHGQRRDTCPGGSDALPRLCRQTRRHLEAALSTAGVGGLAATPEDAAVVPTEAQGQGSPLLQSVDGFPALISDPWLNGRLTALHACSDLWACGASVQSAQAVVTLPLAPPTIQQQLLAQTISGIRSALDPQQAVLIGGHTLEDRNPAPEPCSLGLQLVLSVQGSPIHSLWPKRGLQPGDQLLLSRPLGTGVLFAAAMAGAATSADLDNALNQMQTSQHPLVKQLAAWEQQQPGLLHAATDITGFGLLGHLGEMLGDSATSGDPLQVTLEGSAIPSLPGALALLTAGHASSLAPANRRAWQLLDPQPNRNGAAAVTLNLGSLQAGSQDHRALLELLIDPQTCGPLLISAAPSLADALLNQGQQEWWLIGSARTA